MLQHYLAMLRFNAILGKNDFLMLELKNEKWQNRFTMYNERFSPLALRCFFMKMYPNAQITVHSFEPLRIENPASFILCKSKLNNEFPLGKTCTTLTRAMCVNICGDKKELPLNIKFPFKIKFVFETKVSNKLSENFCLGTNNLEPSKWEKWL
jgi:hypothetical protein